MPHVDFGTKDTQGFELDVRRQEVCSALLHTPYQTWWLLAASPFRLSNGSTTTSDDPSFPDVTF